MLVYDVELVELSPQPAAVVRGHATVAELPQFLGGAFGDVLSVLGQQELEPAGPPFGCYVVSGDGFDVEAGFPCSGPVAPAGRVVAAELPGGPVARVLHRGDYGGVAGAYEAVARWLEEHGYVVSEPPWESYLDGPEVAEPRTLVHQPCRPA